MSNGFNLLDNELDSILSEEEQKKYIELASIGNKEAREILFKHNLRLVAYIVERYSFHTNIIKEDLFQIGCVGLLKAIDNFDIINYDNKFATYAVNKILGEIRCFIRDHGNIFYVERKYYDILNSIIKLKKIYSKGNTNLTTTQISELLNVPEEDIIIALNSSQEVISLSTPGYFNYINCSSIPLVEMIEDTNNSIDVLIDNIDLQIMLKELNEKEEFVIKSLYGINTTQKKQKEIAKILNITQSNVSYISKKAMKKLKESIKK